MHYLLQKIKAHRWLLLLLVIQAGVFSFIHLYGLYKYDANKSFYTGQFIPDNPQGYEMCDDCFYLGWGYKQAYDGHIIFEDKFQGHDTYRKVFHFWWVFGGHLARILGIDIITFNFLQRIFCGLLLSVGIYIFGVAVFKNKQPALYAILFYNFSSFYHFPWPEGCVFVANSAEVILPLGNALLVLLLYATWRFYEHGKGNIWAISFAALMLEMDYPYGMVMYCSAVFFFMFYLLFTKQHKFWYLLRTILTITVPALIVVGYNYYLVATDYRLVDCQANNPSPNLWIILTGYLPFSLMAFVSIALFAFKYRQQWGSAHWLLLFLFLSNLSLIYVPISIIPFQMEMIVGIHLPLAFFSVELIRRIPKPGLQTATALLLTAVSMIPNIQFTRAVVRQVNRGGRPSYIPRPLYEATQWLDKNSKEEEQVWAMNYITSYIPMLSGNRIYNGEYKLITAFFDQRQAKMMNALADTTGTAMQQFITEEKIDYLFYCDTMRAYDKSNYLPVQLASGKLQPVYTNPSVTLYRVMP